MTGLRKRARKLRRQYLPRYLRGLRVVGAAGRYGAPPSFIVAGMQKCGTNAVRHDLALHPAVQMVPDEVHYFDHKHRLPRWWYENHFLRDPAVRSGEATPLYLGKPEAVDRIADRYPDVKLVVVVREPIQRAFSKWNRYRMRGAKAPPFAEALETDFRRLHANGLYARHLRHVLRRFPREQVHVAVAERLRAEPAREYGEMARFLGLPAFPFAGTRERHQGRYAHALEADTVRRLHPLYAGANEELYALLGARVPEWDAWYAGHGLGS